MCSLWQLDTHLRSALQRDPHLAYALAYGSLTQGTADEFSDAEYYCWSEEPVDAEKWLREVLSGTPWRILHAFVNDFGTPNFVLSGLLRVELHSKHVDDLEQILDWANENLFPERMLVKDADGRLARLLAQMTAQIPPTEDVDAQLIFDRLVGWLCFGLNVLARGERIRALELLGWVRGALLRLARLQERATQHWLTPARLAERELSQGSLERYAATAGSLDNLAQNYAAAWQWVKTLQTELGLRLDPKLTSEIEVRLQTFSS